MNIQEQETRLFVPIQLQNIFSYFVSRIRAIVTPIALAKILIAFTILVFDFIEQTYIKLVSETNNCIY